MDKSIAKIREDFDRIANLPADLWNHNIHYYPMILKELPLRMGNVLDVGCGRGDLLRRMATRVERGTGIDLSPNMIDQAIRECRGYPNLDFTVSNVFDWQLPECSLDAVVSVATLHHLPLIHFLRWVRTHLRPGGILVVVDLRRDVDLVDAIISISGVACDLVRRLSRIDRRVKSNEARLAWDEHVRNDHYLSIRELVKVFDKELPGTIIRRHIYFRYSAVWRKE